MYHYLIGDIVKKIIVIIMAMFVLYLLNNSIITEDIVIPNEAIRIRAVANSNSFDDQLLKKQVKDLVQDKLNFLLKDAETIEEVRTIINNNLKDIEDTVKITLSKKGNNNDFFVNFGYNYFPNKKYKGINYKAGYYESLVIKLGKSQGNNWWCILFPPICLIEAEESEKVEYTSFFKTLFDKIIRK